MYCNLSILVGHIRAVHSHEPQLFFTCGIQGCPVTFQNTNTFYKHVTCSHSAEYNKQENKSMHSDDIRPGTSTGDGDQATGTINDDCDENVPSSGDDDTDSHNPPLSSSQHVACVVDTTTIAAGYLLKLKRRPGMTQNALTEVVEMNDAVANSVIGSVSSRLHDVLQTHEVDAHSSLATSIESVLKEHGDPLAGLHTSYRQSSIIQAKYHVVVSLVAMIQNL